MFTGIIEAVGTLTGLTPKGADVTVTVQSSALDLSDVKLGDSIATNGVCLTVIDLLRDGYRADISLETIQRSGFAHYRVGNKVNLEKALTLNTRLGGHLVSGHVDGVGEIVQITKLGRATEYWLKAPDQLARYISEKGSITIDGISLTVNAVDGAKFKLTIVPHTALETTIESYVVGQKVNLEVDVIARYLERIMLGDKAAESSSTEQGITMEFLASNGFLK
jgi:riboflavin synthase